MKQICSSCYNDEGEQRAYQVTEEEDDEREQDSVVKLDAGRLGLGCQREQVDPSLLRRNGRHPMLLVQANGRSSTHIYLHRRERVQKC
jgi:hypothetical protein